MLARIIAGKMVTLADSKRRMPEAALLEQLRNAGEIRPFKEALSNNGVAIIAEVKKASPSRGNLGLTIPVETLAGYYQQGGASAVSVLTEEEYFLGSVADLQIVRAAVHLPVLRKDFIVDRYQLYESRVIGADAVLLIAGLLDEATLRCYLGICRELGLAALVETHTREDLTCAIRAGAGIIGINNRDLNTFKTDILHTINLANLVPDGVLLVSESGIFTAEDVKRLGEAGADAVLVGESLVRSANPAQKIRELLGG
jgi:indole-3-glycerol phosphate synthase